MRIYRKKDLPLVQEGRGYSMYVFIYDINARYFCFGRYDFVNHIWVDKEGMIIGSQDFYWCYLPIKQIKAFDRYVSNNADDEIDDDIDFNSIFS